MFMMRKKIYKNTFLLQRQIVNTVVLPMFRKGSIMVCLKIILVKVSSLCIIIFFLYESYLSMNFGIFSLKKLCPFNYMNQTSRCALYDIIHPNQYKWQTLILRMLTG
jgi:hypothetical protein